ncbi:ATS3-like protein [Mya arenaria]|uniref:ATS3-like protein n=1 Tax=Mya arenaria TaxID=6604 RepID=A0ABY7DU51_MYAAR|nr:ATS3-like protein [Mya arenaria]
MNGGLIHEQVQTEFTALDVYDKVIKLMTVEGILPPINGVTVCTSSEPDGCKRKLDNEAMESTALWLGNHRCDHILKCFCILLLCSFGKAFHSQEIVYAIIEKRPLESMYDCLCGRNIIVIEYYIKRRETDIFKDEFLASLKHYDVIIPSLVTSEGSHVSYALHPSHSLRRRSVNDDVQSTENTLHYSVHIDNKPHVLQLQQNEKLISPGLVIERRKNRFKNVTDSSFSRLSETQTNCHFIGSVLNQSYSRVAVGACNGLKFFVF